MTDVGRTAISHDSYSLIVHSHLRWDFVWQRPQQILSRLARRHAVLFVEEPVFVDDIESASLEVAEAVPGVHRVVPRLPATLRTSYDESATAVRSLLERLIANDARLAAAFGEPVQWFYTPMPAPIMIGAFNERGVVYDCMDELAKFRFAPPELTQREQFLISRADVVFTGGRNLYESKSRRHGNVHFFGCGVDAEHFSRALHADTPIASELRNLPRPILGYFGVIDERLDYALIECLSDWFVSGSVVFVGPTAKVERSELPQQPNIYWIGQRAYERLPEYVKGFDVCLMPFALNEATEYINPTKTLEYMAAGKPIVSTAVPDVLRNFVPVVRIAETAREFVDAVSLALMPEPGRIREGIARARAATWESTVNAMEAVIAQAIHPRRVGRDSRVVPHRLRLQRTTAPGRPETRGDDAAIVA
jgi:glycosyltransferase involved in cell wall biosynthesis